MLFIPRLQLTVRILRSTEEDSNYHVATYERVLHPVRRLQTHQGSALLPLRLACLDARLSRCAPYMSLPRPVPIIPAVPMRVPVDGSSGLVGDGVGDLTEIREDSHQRDQVHH